MIMKYLHFFIFSFCIFSMPTFAQFPDYFGESPSPHHAYWENKGQVVDLNGNQLNDFLYHTDKCFPNIFLAQDRVSFVFPLIDSDTATMDTISRFDLIHVGELVNTEPDLEASEQVGGYLNFLLPQCVDPETGEFLCSGVNGYSRIIYHDLYEGINLHVYSNASGVKLYYEVEPGANPNQIMLQVEGLDSLHVHPYYLELYQSNESFELPAAIAYQIDGEDENPIITPNWTPSFTQQNGDEVMFNLGTYNTDLPLILQIGVPQFGYSANGDPIKNLEWSTYYGGAVSKSTSHEDIAVDRSGNLYTVGSTFSPVADASSGAFRDFIFAQSDIFIAKFEANTQKRIYGTYYGGNHLDLVPNITVNDTGNAIVAFQAQSDNLPLGINHPGGAYVDPSHNTGTKDNFIVKISSNGRKVQWGTYYGGSGTETPLDIGFDTINKHIYVVGYVSGEFPIEPKVDAYNSLNGSGFVIKFDQELDLDWATRYGVNFTSLNSVAFDENGNTYIVGSSPSGADTHDPGGNSFYRSSPKGGSTDADAVLIKLDSDDDMVWGTYFGSTSGDNAKGVAYYNNQVYVTGRTTANDLDLRQYSVSGSYYNPNFNSSTEGDAYFAMFKNDGELLWSTYFGGLGDDAGENVTVDRDANVYFVGYSFNGQTAGHYFPFKPGDNNTFFSGSNAYNSSFLAAFRSDLKRTLTTAIGGDGDNNIPGIAAYSDEYLYIGGGTRAKETTFPLVDLGGVAYFEGIKAQNSVFSPFAARFDISYFSSLTGFENNLVTEIADVLIYPNPANQTLFVSGKNLQNIKIMDVSGKLIFERNINSDFEQINVNSLSKGVYLMQVLSNSGISTQKVIIE